ncbi:HEAT repeat domain-containing protein [Kitasatospora sp. NPDC088346]|uniref:HEAT repeat domain-containing protein n=1 Tax=Kitasatospora sp. NPDC088346 TaxID=3364073 RepID=UPI00380D7153
MSEDDADALLTAVRHGDLPKVRDLLAAGVPAEPADGAATGPLVVAAAAGDGAMAALLVEYGADPDRTPALARAAERGAYGAVRALLDAGADPAGPDADGRTPLECARGWLGRDPVEELRRRLTAAAPGPVAVREPAAREPVAVRREEQPDGTALLTVELTGVGGLPATAGVQDGHAAVVCLLEAALGVEPPFEELAARALAAPDSEHPCWWEPVRLLHARGGEPAFRGAERLCGGTVREREFGADVLAQFDYASRDRPHAGQVVALLRRMAAEERDPAVLRSVVSGLGHQRDPAALPDLARHVHHPDPRVRHSVAFALAGLVGLDRPEGMDLVTVLLADPDEGVRDWAAFALASVEGDSPALRDALAGLLDDPADQVVAEAARGLAHRGDPRAVGPLLRILAGSDPAGYAWKIALEAAEEATDPRLRAAARTAATGTWGELRSHGAD